VISRATQGKAITPRQYIDHIKENPDGKEASILAAFKNCYIVTRSHKLARKVLSLGKLLIPIVVRFASRHLKTFEQFLVHLETQNFVEVHFLNRDQKTTANFVVPDPVSGQEITEEREMDCLNLKIWKENPTPQCLVDLPDYQVLSHIRDSAGADDQIDSGKASEVLVRDLSNCVFF
jgi:hypothetical protein